MELVQSSPTAPSCDGELPDQEESEIAEQNIVITSRRSRPNGGDARLPPQLLASDGSVKTSGPTPC